MNRIKLENREVDVKHKEYVNNVILRNLNESINGNNPGLNNHNNQFSDINNII